MGACDDTLYDAIAGSDYSIEIENMMLLVVIHLVISSETNMERRKVFHVINQCKPRVRTNNYFVFSEMY